MAQSLLVLIAVTIAGGLIPLFGGRSDRFLHLLISLATGLFLGVVFLHMLPSLSELGEHGAGAAEGHSDLLWLCVLVGVVGLWLLQNLALDRTNHSDAHRHRTLGWAAFLGLCVHAFAAGLGLAVAGESPVLGTTALLSSIALHKASEGFSLTTVFRLAGLPRTTSLALVGGFSLVTPLGVVVGNALVSHLPASAVGLLTALAAGTFLFVSLYDLLPEVFHHREDLWAKVLLLAGGVALSSSLHEEGSFAWFGDFVVQTAALVAEAAPYLLFGFLLAGLIKVFLPGRAVTRRLGGNGFRPVLLATLYGMPLPLCSCSVIPTAVSLRKSGASKGATSSFLISTPETGIDSISITYALLDPFMTVVRPVLAFVTALATGMGTNLLVRRGWDGVASAEEANASPGPETVCCDAAEGVPPEKSDPPVPEALLEGDDRSRPLGARLRRAVEYAFGPLLDDLTPSLVVGLLVSGLIAAVVPASVFTDVVPRGWASLILMLIVGTPMYICAASSTPVAAALIAKGLDPGAALVFLLVGPATNVTTLLVVLRFLGSRVLVLYLVSIVGLSLAGGAIVSRLYAAWGVDLGAKVAEHLHGGPGLVTTLSGVLLALLLVRSAQRIGWGRGWWRQVGVESP